MKRIIVLGGRGRVGSILVAWLVDKGHSVALVDLVDSTGVSKNDESSSFYVIPGDRDSFESAVTKAAEYLGGAVDVFISASRYRNTSLNHKDNIEILRPLSFELDSHFESSVFAPIRAIEVLLQYFTPNSKVIAFCSSNATSVSHQSLGYHVSAAGLLQACRVLGIRLGKREIEVYPLVLGVLERLDIQNFNSAGDNEVSVDAGYGDHVVSISDVKNVIELIIEHGLKSALGDPIFLSAGRTSMDVTAAVDGYFGDIGVHSV